jgi:hypothetical protein
MEIAKVCGTLECMDLKWELMDNCALCAYFDCYLFYHFWNGSKEHESKKFVGNKRTLWIPT